MKWRHRSNAVLSLSVLIAILVLRQIGMYAIHLLFGVNAHLNIFKFCVSLFKQNFIYFQAVSYAVIAFVAHIILIFIVRLIQQYVRMASFKNTIQSLQLPVLTSRIHGAYGAEGSSVIVIGHRQPLAFTMGFRSPVIVLSSGLIELLDSRELEAVIAHESFHRTNYDALKLFVLQLIAQSLWFIPLTKWSYANYKIICELQADEHAVGRMGSELGLGGALLKMLQSGIGGSADKSPVLASFSDEAVNFRLRQLVDPQNGLPVKLKKVSIVISVITLAFMMAVTIIMT